MPAHASFAWQVHAKNAQDLRILDGTKVAVQNVLSVAVTGARSKRKQMIRAALRTNRNDGPVLIVSDNEGRVYVPNSKVVATGTLYTHYQVYAHTTTHHHTRRHTVHGRRRRPQSSPTPRPGSRRS